jgi:hypothetical protein
MLINAETEVFAAAPMVMTQMMTIIGEVSQAMARSLEVCSKPI